MAPATNLRPPRLPQLGQPEKTTLKVNPFRTELAPALSPRPAPSVVSTLPKRPLGTIDLRKLPALLPGRKVPIAPAKTSPTPTVTVPESATPTGTATGTPTPGNDPQQDDRQQDDRPAAAPPEVVADAPSLVTTTSPSHRAQDQDPFQVVEVFYATDRLATTSQPALTGVTLRRLVPVITAAAVACLLFLGACGLKCHRRWYAVCSLLAFGLSLGLSVSILNAPGSTSPDLATGAWGYGNQRGEFQLGVCQVSIPNTHQRGNLERPQWIRLEFQENEAEHVVLQEISRADEADFYADLQQRVAQSEHRDAFVFVHGYNVEFNDAAMRTAQIAHDMNFQGAPIFYSWPSQGGLLKYTVDETNVQWTVPHLKKFLHDVAQQSQAKSVHLIAHSMGNRALTAALCDLARDFPEQQPLFDQLVLAAPDIDADVFRRDIAPLITPTSQQVTLYASSNDNALIASKKIHGSPRAGDSGAGLIVIPNIETIDVSTVDTSMLGHSYYGSSGSILRDLAELFYSSNSAHQRPGMQPVFQDPLTYWIFDSVIATAQRSSPLSHR